MKIYVDTTLQLGEGDEWGEKEGVWLSFADTAATDTTTTRAEK